MTRALNATGTTVTSAGLVLAGTFGVFALVGARTSGGSQFVNLAGGLALDILMDTFLVRTLLVPSTVLLLGRWKWWPSKMSRRPAAVPPAGADQAAPAPPPASPYGPLVLDATGDQPEVAADRLSACAVSSHPPG